MYILFFCLFCIRTYEVEAAEKREGFISTDGSYVKVGKYFYTYLDEWYCSDTKGSIGTMVLSENGKTTYNSLYVYKNQIYYVCLKQAGDYHYKASIWKMRLNGTGKQKIASIKEKIGSGNIELINQNHIIFVCGDGIENRHVHSINLKTKRQKTMNQAMDFVTKPYKKLNGIEKPCQYRQYAVASNIPTGELWYGTVWIYNSLNQKITQVTDKGWDTTIRKKYVYYLEQKGKNVCLMRCNMKGKQKKKIASMKSSDPSGKMFGAMFDKLTDQYCDIQIGNNRKNYYRYRYNTKICKKIKK